MKIFSLLMSLIVISANSFAQRSEVISDSIDKKEAIFSKSLLWVAKTWKNSNEVVQMKDEASGTIVVKGGLASVPKSVGIPAKGITMTTLTIQVKDGKAKLTFDDTNFKWETGSLWKIAEPKSGGQYEKWATAVNGEIDNLIAEYKKSVAASTDF